MEVRDLDLNLIRVLHALLRERNVTHAAAQVGLSQTATSHALARLRRAFDDRLLVRVGRGLQLTPEAERLRPIAAEIMRLVDDGLASPPFEPSTYPGEFTAVMPDFLNELLLPEISAQVRAAAPHATLNATSMPTRTVSLEQGSVDAMALPASRVPDGEDSLPLGDVRWTGVAWEGNRAVSSTMTPAEFAALPHIVVRHAQVHDEVDAKLGEHGLERRVVLTVTNTGLIALLLPGTELVTISWHGASFPQTRSFDLPVQVPGTGYRLMWSRRLADDPASIWFRQLIVRIAAGHLLPFTSER